MKLRFLDQNTRYEILYAVGELSRWLVNPGQEHVKAFKRVLRYLKGTHDYKLIYRRTNRRGDNDDYIIDDECVGYADASWAECPDTGLSTTGYVFMMCGAALCTRTLRQRIIATSTAEAELLALNTAGKQGVWLRLLREQLGMDNSKPMILMEDNEAAKRIAETGRRSKRTKHFRVREFWINKGGGQDVHHQALPYDGDAGGPDDEAVVQGCVRETVGSAPRLVLFALLSEGV